MVSDTLFEALREIDTYMDVGDSVYEGEARQKINELRVHMADVLIYLDTPPGTKQETAAQNEA